MTCGLTGSGKSTLARGICDTWSGFERLSIDAIILREWGVFGVGYRDVGILFYFIFSCGLVFGKDMVEFTTTLNS